MFREDIYQLLGISKKTPTFLVKKSFRDFAKKNHPDFFPGDLKREEKFKRVSSAYQSWKLVQGTIGEIKRLRLNSDVINPPGFRPWKFSCNACE